jgi:hypothetical protein
VEKFGPEREELAGGWTRLHNLYASRNIIRVIKSRRMKLTGHVARMGEMRNAFKILVDKPEGKRPLGRTRYKWDYNIRMDLRELGWEDVGWMHLAQDRASGGLL